MERDPAGAGTVLWALRGELLGLPFTPAQNKAASCQKLAFPQSHGRPRSPDLTPYSLRPRSPGPQHPPPQGPRGPGLHHSASQGSRSLGRSTLTLGRSGAQCWPPFPNLCLWERLLNHRPHWRARWVSGPRPPQALGALLGSPPRPRWPAEAPRPPSHAPCRPPAARHLQGASRSRGSSDAFILRVTGGVARRPGLGWDSGRDWGRGPDRSPRGPRPRGRSAAPASARGRLGRRLRSAPP